MRGLVASSGRSGSVLRSVLAGVALVVLVIGVPIVLMAVGSSPIPSGIGSVLRTSLQGSPHVSNEHLVVEWIAHVVLLGAWLAWLWLTVCVVLEVVSWLTGRSSRSSRGRTMHAVAALLVGTTFAALSLGRLSPGTGAPLGLRAMALDRPVVASTEVAIPEECGTMKGAAVAGSGVERSPSSDGIAEHGTASERAMEHRRTSVRTPERYVVVDARESLWSIAERELGSPLRWREIAALNYGRTQGDGHTLTDDHWVRPGWSLLLPDGRGPSAEGREPVPERSATTRVPMRTVDDELPVADGPTVADQRGTLDVPTSSRATVDLGDTWRGSPARGIAFAMAGAAVVGSIDRLRRVQQRRRTTGGLIRLPEEESIQFERRLRAGAAVGVPGSIHRTLAAYLSMDGADGNRMPRVLEVRSEDDRVDLVLEHPLPADQTPLGFSLTDDGLIVSSSAIGSDGNWTGAAGPVLVTVGHTDRGVHLISLSTVGSLALVGDRTVCTDLLRSIAVELAAGEQPGYSELVVVGFAGELRLFPWVRVADDVSQILGLLHHRRSADRLYGSTGRVDREWMGSTHVGGSDPDRGALPVVVLCGPDVGRDEVDELLSYSSALHSSTASTTAMELLVVAVTDSTDAGRILRLTDVASESGSDGVRPIEHADRLESGELSSIVSLVETASDRHAVDDSTYPYESISPVGEVMPIGEHPSGASGALNPDGLPRPEGLPAPHRRNGDGEVITPGDVEIEVAVLGPVEIRGAYRPFTRAWAEELVVYLSMHPEGATNDKWATALWPERLMAPSSLHSTASVARRSLGQSRSGRDHLPRGHGRLVLGASVGTDWGRFERLVSSDDPEMWSQALDLVRGRPFEGLRSGDWPILEGIAPMIEARVVDVSTRLAEHCFSVADPRRAEWAARKGLLVSPYDERLYRILLRAADLAGNPAGVEAVMAELVRLVADDVEPYDSVHPETMGLYRSLTRRRSLASTA